ETGRVFTTADVDGGTHGLIVLSHRVWTERYGRDPQFVGRTVRLDRTLFTVVGVMPSRFAENVEAWLPLVPDLVSAREDRRCLVVGRLGPNATLQRAQAEITGIAGALAAEHPSTNANWTMTPTPLARLRARESGGGYYQLQGAVGVLLLAVCANVANLLL